MPSSSAVALTSVRIACAVRPCRPMTRPRSPGAMNSSTSVWPLCSRSVTRTASGMIGERPGDDLDDVSRAAHDARLFTGAPAAGAAGMRATSVRTVSDGCAPALSQCSSRSRLISSVSGLVRGL